MPKMNMVQAINLGLDQEMAKDPTVLVMGEDVGVNGGVFRVTDGLHAKYGEMRVLDTPLAESGIMGTAIGMAVNGLKPVAEMQFCGFSYIMMHHLEGHANRLRHRSRGVWTVPLVMRVPYGGGIRALEHHSESPEATYAHLPGIKVVVPSTPRNARALIVASIRDPDPVVFLEPKRSYRAFREEVPEAEEVGVVGKAEVVQEGTDITVIAYGAMMRTALEAVEAVQAKTGAKIELIDLLTVSPMDIETITSSVRKTGRLVVVQEAPRSFGAAAEIMAQVNDHVFYHLEAPAKRVTGYDVITPFFGRELMYMPSAARVRRAIEETLAA